MWWPQPGPQLEAYVSEADEIYYGGQAGGGKTDLLIGLSVTEHYKSIIFRREYPQLKDIIWRSREIIGDNGKFAGGGVNTWRGIDGERILEFGAVQYDDHVNKYKGRPHDFIGYDELPDFSLFQYKFLSGWLRSTRPGQRVRIIGAGNPPTTVEGEWVIRYWGPWIDTQHPYPAKVGELRWFVSIEGEDREVEDGTPIEYKGDFLIPRSRTFIPARLSDNVYLKYTNYGSVLQGLPEPLRSQLLKGDFAVGRRADPWQVIPGEWVQLAVRRWENGKQPEAPVTSFGLDVARGGGDELVLAARRGSWFDPLRTWPGSMVPRSQEAVEMILPYVTQYPNAPINVDVIGVGSAVFDTGSVLGLDLIPFNASVGSDATDKSGLLRFVNKRAEAYWKFREALDPESDYDIALPPDPNLIADLTSVKWSVRRNGIQIEDKADVKKRIGRSPDKGDAVVMAWQANQAPLVLYNELWDNDLN